MVDSRPFKLKFDKILKNVHIQKKRLLEIYGFCTDFVRCMCEMYLEEFLHQSPRHSD